MTSLTDELVDLRRRYTGEHPSRIKPAIKRAANGLTNEDRQQVVNLLHTFPDGLGPIGPASPDEVRPALRQAFFPDAESPAQRVLETELLQAASRATRGVDEPAEAAAFTPHPVFRSVYLTPDSLTVDLHPDMLGRMLAELLPRVVGNEFRGVPGLRYRQERRCAEFFLLGPEPNRVFLTGAKATTMRDGLAEAEHLVAGDGADATRLWTDSTRLAPEEVREGGVRDTGQARLASAILRRIPLLRDAPWVRASIGSDTWHLEWPDGPSRPDIARRLLHPLFGLPGRFTAVDGPVESVRLVPAGSPRDQSRPALWLRRPPEPPGSGPPRPRLIEIGGRPDEVWLMDLIKRYQSAVKRHLRQYTSDQDAIEEVTQQAFIQAWLRRDDGIDTPLSWLIAVAKYQLWKQWRGQERGRRTWARLRVSDLSNDGGMGHSELCSDLAIASRVLTEKERDCLIFNAIDGLSDAEIAQILGISRDNVRQQRHRAREKLRRAMYGESDPA